MLGAVLAMIGLGALLAGSCEIAKLWADRVTARQLDRDRRELRDVSARAEPICPWPPIGPEVEALRRAGAL